jgi:hypothetical protein
MQCIWPRHQVSVRNTDTREVRNTDTMEVAFAKFEALTLYMLKIISLLFFNNKLQVSEFMD